MTCNLPRVQEEVPCGACCAATRAKVPPSTGWSVGADADRAGALAVALWVLVLDDGGLSIG